MNAATRFALDNELEVLDRVIKAAEDWSKEYAKDAATHDLLIKNEARLERILRKFFRDQAEKAYDFVDWAQYSAAIKAYEVNTIVQDQPLNDMDLAFITVAIDPIAEAAATGSQAAEAIYQLPSSLESTDAIIQNVARQQVAQLVGKTLKPDGQMVNNPKADYRISDKARNDIRESLHTSISMGENIDQAATRIGKVIANPKRAQMIARTETVNAYQNGLLESGRQSGAVGKEWQDLGAIDVCAQNTSLGPIDINKSFKNVSGYDIAGPTAHPGCRCGMRLIYPIEADEKGYKF